MHVKFILTISSNMPKGYNKQEGNCCKFRVILTFSKGFSLKNRNGFEYDNIWNESVADLGRNVN
jgi:hypothetical protein